MNMFVIVFGIIILIGVVYWVKEFIKRNQASDLLVGCFLFICLILLIKFIFYLRKEGEM